jgi:catechol 2,3-dioxygenase-like lactoylglutathione lyase family enzyme
VSTRLTTLCIDANDPLALARFWADTLGWEVDDPTSDEIALLPGDGTPFHVLFLPVPEPKAGKNRIHLDLVSETPDQHREMVDRLMALGASPADIGQGNVPWTVLADPEGNEFCVLVRGEFLATTGLLGSIVFEPAAHPAVGRFWSEATGWPVVYDQDGDIAIRDPSGRGPFITFGPPIPQAKTGKNRLHLDIAPPPDGDQEAEVERLIALGARRVDIGQGDVTWVVMADPDGNEFCVLTPR